MSLTGSSRSVSVAVVLLVCRERLDRRVCVGPGDHDVPPRTERRRTAIHSSRHWTVTITRIVDGDTVEFRYANGTAETGRLLGVDTPEVHTENDPTEFERVPDDANGKSCLRDWGHKASEFARTELVDERVTITLDANEEPRGYYGRLLIYVRESDGTLFNYQLVKQGYARVYDSEFTKRDRFYAAESPHRRTASASGSVRTGRRAGMDGEARTNRRPEWRPTVARTASPSLESTPTRTATTTRT